MFPRVAVLLVVAIAATFLDPHGVRADETVRAPSTVDFVKDVVPLLERRCFKCHQGPNCEAGIRLDVRESLLSAKNDEPVVNLGHSSESKLIKLVSRILPDQQMPPKEEGTPLSDAEITLLKNWIDQGLPWDEKILPVVDHVASHWTFQPLKPVPVPRNFGAGWSENPVDVFIAEAHSARNLSPAPPASRQTLIRRLYLDLLGLPPSPEHVEAFIHDSAPDALPRLVDTLLASPHYGERWGRFWLDVARWADSEGYENNHLRPFAWRYRDFVISSFNADKPFDWFITQQIAGDELLPYSDENLIATGFLAAARYSSNEEDKLMQRNDVLVDIVNATSSAFLGLTLACAQCHNHKFDPLTQADYYRLQGFFVQGQMNDLQLKDPELWKAYEAAPKPAGFQAADELRNLLYNQSESRLVHSAREKLSDPERTALDTPSDRRTPEQRSLAELAEVKIHFTIEDIERGIEGDDKKLYEALKKKLESWEKELPPKPQTIGFYSPVTSPTPVTVMQMKANYPLPYDPLELRRTKPALLVRGDPHRHSDELTAGWPRHLAPTPPDVAKSNRRTDLAGWLTDPANPLVARVWVNRLWAWHFGQGLSDTPGDFGLRGHPPTHPQLLDFLANELVRSGWSTRHIHRLIVTSATYQQSTAPHPESLTTDPDNRFLTRWSTRRLESEAVRDLLLAASGELDPTPFGPAVALKEANKWLNDLPVESGLALRRSLYLEMRRDTMPPMHSLFDGPTANESCPHRHISTVPLQPLFLLNNPFVVDRARAFADRLQREAGPDLDRQITRGFQITVGRHPTEQEHLLVTNWLNAATKTPVDSASAAQHRPTLLQFCHMLLNLNEFIYIH